MRSGTFVIAVVFFLVFSGLSCSGPSEEQQLYREVQNLLDAWKGETTILHQADLLLQGFQLKYPKSALPHVALGRLSCLEGYIGLEEYDPEALRRAHAFFAEARRRDPSLYDICRYEALAYIYSKDYATARARALKCRELDKKSPWTDLLLAEIALRENNYERAIELAESIDTKSAGGKLKADTYTILARSYQALGKNGLAGRAYREAVKLEPESPWILLYFSGFLTENGAIDEAVKYGELSLGKLDSEQGHIILNKAYLLKAKDLYWNKQKPDKAIIYFQLAVQHDPYDANAYYGLGLCYLRDGSYINPAEAEAAFKKALLINPYHQQAKNELNRIRRAREERR